jgi:uncharacterized protein with ParB-like and HNH nuclease domain
MKADAMSLTFLGNEGVVKIPFFQRGYVWDKTNWEDLLIDLLDTTKSPFLGSLILKQMEKQTGKIKEVLVIDGQQRLTTLSILLKALYDSFPDDVKDNCKSSLHACLFYKKQRTDKDLHIKIIHSRLDAQYYDKVINGKLQSDEFDRISIADETNKYNSKDNRILQCYKYFVGKLGTIDARVRENLFNTLLDNENKILVLIDLSEKDDEQAIFDTINSAGVRLSGADIIKNALFQKALEIFDKQEDVLKLYKDNWDDVFSLDDDANIFWDTPRSTGRLMRDNIEILLHSIAVIKNFFDPDKHTLSDLSKLFKKYIDSLDKNNLKSFIEEISQYAKLYREKIMVFDKSTLFSFENYTQRLFHILDVCEISTFHPYILSLFYKNKDDDSLLTYSLLKLEKFIIRRMITKKETKSYNKTCKEFIKDNMLINAKIDEINNSDLLTSLENISNKYASLLLFWIELFRRNNDTKQSVKDLKYNYSLEHIMPQKWEQYWSVVDFVDHNGFKIDISDSAKRDNAKRERYSKIYSIGNMTLLNSSLNTSLRNYIFEKKIEGEGKKRGIRYYSELSITKDDILLNYDNGDRIWNEKKINDRTLKIGSEIIKIW